MHIQQVAPADLADLAELARLFSGYLHFYRADKPLSAVEAFLAERLRRGDSTILLARDGRGTALGFVQLYPLFASLALRPAWLLSDLYVREDARRQGVAATLMAAAHDHAEAGGACAVQLETAKDNLAAQALYERLGYVRDQVFYTYWLDLPRRGED